MLSISLKGAVPESIYNVAFLITNLDKMDALLFRGFYI
jgi:hypothetical protein